MFHARSGFRCCLAPLMGLLFTLTSARAQEADPFEGVARTINGFAEPLAKILQTVVFWGPTVPGVGTMPLIIFILAFTGLFLTIHFRFINLRSFGLAWRTAMGKYSDPKAPGEITHFQALTAALSATVGLGNIAGVATAVGVGGPGAAFWLAMSGFVGMASKFAECTLGVRYRKIDEYGKVHGGAMYYLTRGLGEKGPTWAKIGAVLAFFFAIFTIGGAIGGGNMYQINQAHTIVSSTFAEELPFFTGTRGQIIFGLVTAGLVASITLGGIKAIGRVAEFLVPFMCGLFTIGCLAIVALHWKEVPQAVGTIFTMAFSPQAVAGGVLGAVIQGMRRGTFSNEAGIGSAPIAHSAVKTHKPASEGVVGLLEPFVDTVVMCSITALALVVSGDWKVDGLTLKDNVAVRVVTEEARFGGATEPRADKEVLPASEVLATVPRDTGFRFVGGTLPDAKLSPAVDAAAPAWGQVYPMAETVELLRQSVPNLSVLALDQPSRFGVKEVFALPDAAGQARPVELWLPVTPGEVANHMTILKTKRAFEELVPWMPWFPLILAVSVFLFAFATMLSWGYYGEQAVIYLAGGTYKPKLVVAYKLTFCAFIVLGCLLPVSQIVDICDALFFMMIVPNLVGVYFLLPKVKESLDDFLSHAKAIDRGEKTREDL